MKDKKWFYEIQNKFNKLRPDSWICTSQDINKESVTEQYIDRDNGELWIVYFSNRTGLFSTYKFTNIPF